MLTFHKFLTDSIVKFFSRVHLLALFSLKPSITVYEKILHIAGLYHGKKDHFNF